MCWCIPYRCFTDYEWEDDDLIEAQRFRWNGQAWELQLVRAVSGLIRLKYPIIHQTKLLPVLLLFTFLPRGTSAPSEIHPLPLSRFELEFCCREKLDNKAV